MASAIFAPRSLEFHRGVLERRLLQDTVGLPNSSIAENRLRYWCKLFSQHQKQFPDERHRRKNDIDRRRAVGHLMRWRAQKGVEEEGAETKWFHIANYEKNRPGEKEDQHRAWIIAELEKRFAPYDWESAQLRSKNDHHAKKAASRLLQDTLALKNHGGIPTEEIAWLETVLGEKSTMDTWEDKEADDAVRGFGVNYIAACRRAANVQQELETLYTHRGYSFEQIDHYLTIAKLDELLQRSSSRHTRLQDVDSEALDDDVGEETSQSIAGTGPAMSLPGFVRQLAVPRPSATGSG